MPTQKNRTLSAKVWLEHKGNTLIGKGGAEILTSIEKNNSISRAAVALNMSYRYVWNYIQKIENTIGEPVVETYKGGKAGGGGAKLTDLGRSLLAEYTQLENYMKKALLTPNHRETTTLKGKLATIEKENNVAKVTIKVNDQTTVTTFVPEEKIEKMNLKIGNEVKIIIRYTEVEIEK
ncbi:MAG: LysR family transcriptional regulator [Candidatus Bathyarchaeota archaeon]|nr:LysR family transcriptional regulator [Candidatus Bathyarchaeota archaeon]